MTEEEPAQPMIKYGDFAKLELKVGEIKTAERVEGTDKLVRLSVDVGEEAERTLVAGIGLRYQPEELIGMKIIVLCNLEPRKLKGIISEGMLLAAGEAAEEVALLTIDGIAPAGSKIS